MCGAASAYFRVDAATGGRYRGRLRFAAGAVCVAGGVAAILLRFPRQRVLDLCARGLLPYVIVGTHRRVGWKNGEWRDVTFLQATIAAGAEPPAEPT